MWKPLRVKQNCVPLQKTREVAISFWSEQGIAPCVCNRTHKDTLPNSTGLSTRSGFLHGMKGCAQYDSITDTNSIHSLTSGDPACPNTAMGYCTLRPGAEQHTVCCPSSVSKGVNMHFARDSNEIQHTPLSRFWKTDQLKFQKRVAQNRHCRPALPPASHR